MFLYVGVILLVHMSLLLKGYRVTVFTLSDLDGSRPCRVYFLYVGECDLNPSSQPCSEDLVKLSVGLLQNSRARVTGSKVKDLKQIITMNLQMFYIHIINKLRLNLNHICDDVGVFIGKRSIVFSFNINVCMTMVFYEYCVILPVLHFVSRDGYLNMRYFYECV